ncbi:nucleotidyltransferase, partial [Granulicatella balaenopterae]
KENQVEVAYAYQDLANIPKSATMPDGRTKPWGTGQAVLACKDIVKEPFAVINADDYYGKAAFSSMYDYLQGYTKANPHDYCMAGFKLKNTLSDNGGVTRGICQVNETNHLDTVVETHNIIKTATGAESEGQAIDVESYVSMNMWGLTPEYMDLLEVGFEDFFNQDHPDMLKVEYLLPMHIGDLLEADKVSVKLLETNDKWFGMTYHEDKKDVAQAFDKLISDGLYQRDLFSDL